MNFVGVQPLEVLRFEPVPGERAYVSLGMSRYPMTGSAEWVIDSDGPRAELVLHLRDALDDHADVWRQLAVLAAAPVVEGLVYAVGVTVDLGRPLASGSHCTGAVVVESALDPVDTSDGPVQFLQLLPATSTELAWCRVQGSSTALRRRWTEQGADLLDLARPPANLA